MNEKALVRVTRATSARTASFPMWQGASWLSASSNRIESNGVARRGDGVRDPDHLEPTYPPERWSVELLEHRSAANDAQVRSVGHFSNGCYILFPIFNPSRLHHITYAGDPGAAPRGGLARSGGAARLQ